MTTDFLEVTETALAPISAKQLERMVSRYCWAASYCRDKEVVEVGCGAGPGLGLLAATARTLVGGDFSEPILAMAREHYGQRFELRRIDAEALPFADSSKDVIILLEAIYYLSHPERFVAECARVLRPGGKVLIASANKDIWDFHPSPFSHRYFGVPEFHALFSAGGFDCQFFGFEPVDSLPLRQRLLRPVKRALVKSGMMPKTMSGKRWLKRIVFGAEQTMPRELTADTAPYVAPSRLTGIAADLRHRIIYCAATLGSHKAIN